MSAYIKIPDQDLISALKAGDQQAFNEIYNRYWKSLYHTANNILQDKDLAADAIQEVFISLWLRKAQVDILSLKSYLHQAVRFTVLKAIRAQKTDQQFYDRLAMVTSEIIAENPLLFKEQQYLILDLIEQLPGECKETFKLSREENLTYKQIATQLSISEKTVEKRMTKSLKVLRGGLNLEVCIAIISWHLLS
jgi:RNA polymerase sigma-70 factor (family 1)